jgi:hypothetical protein
MMSALCRARVYPRRWAAKGRPRRDNYRTEPISGVSFNGKRIPGGKGHGVAIVWPAMNDANGGKIAHAAYEKELRHREEAGTPGIVENIRCGPCLPRACLVWSDPNNSKAPWLNVRWNAGWGTREHLDSWPGICLDSNCPYQVLQHSLCRGRRGTTDEPRLPAGSRSGLAASSLRFCANA